MTSADPGGARGGAPAPAGRIPYVLITPAHNEAAFLEQTLQCVLAQTVRPRRWVIVNDGSTDATAAIAGCHAARHDWITLVSLPERRERHFAGKAQAFKAGLDRVKDLPYEVIGNLDADLTFESDHFAYLLDQFASNPRLGVAGAPFREGGATYDYRFTNIEHVSGACQLFRRVCFEEIGGYVPIREGGIDLVAVLTARMKGWETRTFTGRVMVHHRRTQTGGAAGLKATFRSGYHDYLMGNPPAWQAVRCLYQMTRKPCGLGGLLLFLGYGWALLRRPPRPISPELVRFRKQEQARRLWRYFAARPARQGG